MNTITTIFKKGAAAPAILSQHAFLTPGGIVRICAPLPYSHVAFTRKNTKKKEISIFLYVVLIFFVSLPHQNLTVMLKETFSKNHNFKAGTVRHGETYGGGVRSAVFLHRLFSLPKSHNYAKFPCKSCSDSK